jgi:thiamine transport system ATP-binding protein
MLHVAGLRVTYDGGAVAADDVDLDAAAGTTVALLGPSGSGKSTVLRAIAGLIPTDAGTISIDGVDVSKLPPDQRGVGLMFQDYALFPHRDVAGNVGFGARMAGLDRRAVAQRTEEVLGLVGLDGFGRRSISSLSGGEQQRVALARALAPSPKVLLLDEPLGSLDRALRERLAVELRDLFTLIGCTVVTVTHDQAEAFTMADRVVLLRAGRVVQEGTPIDVWRAPPDAEAARFLGFANVSAVKVVGGSAPSPWGAIATSRPDGPAALVLRPQGVTLGEGPVRGRAGHARFRGAHFVVPVALRSGGLIEVVVADGDVPVAGADVGVDLDATQAIVVDP